VVEVEVVVEQGGITDLNKITITQIQWVPVAAEVAHGVDLVEMLQVDKPVGGKLGSMDITAEVQEVLAAHQVRHTVETVEVLDNMVNRHQPSQAILGTEEI